MLPSAWGGGNGTGDIGDADLDEVELAVDEVHPIPTVTERALGDDGVIGRADIRRINPSGEGEGRGKIQACGGGRRDIAGHPIKAQGLAQFARRPGRPAQQAARVTVAGGVTGEAARAFVEHVIEAETAGAVSRRRMRRGGDGRGDGKRTHRNSGIIGCAYADAYQ